MPTTNYTINDIESLSFRDGVRKRIQMYLGSDDIEGVYQAFKEIINNSTDEALAGYGNRIEIELNENNGLRIRDYGRGVPFGIRENGENVLVSIFTKSHTGGKFNEGAYKNASGLNGIGGSCVCLSSEYFDVWSYRDGKCAHASFKQGELICYDEFAATKPTGTCIEFKPDPEVFKNGDITYSYERLCNDIKDISYLYDGISFTVKHKNQTNTYCAKNGIVDFVKDNITKPLHPHIITGNATDGIDTVEIAFQWGSKHEQPYTFVNGLRCPEGGSPITGAKTAITKVFNNLSGTSFDGDLIRQNLFYVINCKVSQPSFANQTKTKINNANLRTLASNAFTEALKGMKAKYSSEFETILGLLNKIAKAEKAAENARQKVLDATKDIEANQKRKVFASDKLKDAEHLGENSVLLLVEGNSAAASMAVARDISKYGILALRGKVINCLANNDEDIYDNEEIKLLLSAMNITPGKYNSKKLRYGKIAICTDADSDGAHIGLLIMSALQYLAPEFIKEGRLCWLRSPLWIVKSGKYEQYYYSDEEIKNVTIAGELQRNKGLGSLSAEQARNSMFNLTNQRMDKLAYDTEAIELLYELMGDNPQPRTDYVFKNIDFSLLRE